MPYGGGMSPQKNNAEFSYHAHPYKHGITITITNTDGPQETKAVVSLWGLALDRLEGFITDRRLKRELHDRKKQI